MTDTDLLLQQKLYNIYREKWRQADKKVRDAVDDTSKNRALRSMQACRIKMNNTLREIVRLTNVG